VAYLDVNMFRTIPRSTAISSVALTGRYALHNSPMKLSKSLLVIPAASFLFAVAVGSGACSSSVSFALPSGAADVTTSFGTCSDATGYIIVDSTACDGAGLSCSGDYYALCDGSAFTACSCDIPSGDVIITSADYSGVPSGDVGSSGGDGGTTSTGDGGTTTAEGGTTTGDAGTSTGSDSGTSTGSDSGTSSGSSDAAAAATG